jgi:hypothetical protein
MKNYNWIKDRHKMEGQKFKENENPRSSSPFDTTKERFFRIPGEILFCSGLELSASEISWKSKGQKNVSRTKKQTPAS